MKIYEMKLEGQTNRKTGNPYAKATVSRYHNSDTITVILHTGTELLPNDREHKVQADDETDVFSMAEILQECLDGCRGTNSMVHDYYRLLQHFMD
ncbi:MAG: hypothetical protein GXY41_08765 [Phycisphaerae bacterium]|nr:hypothetical protein [Phycisphaerae bacterium]